MNRMLGIFLPCLFASAVHAAPILIARGGPVVVAQTIGHSPPVKSGGPVLVHQPPTPPPAPIGVRDAARRMNAMRAFAPKTPATTQPKIVTAGYSAVKLSMSIPDNLGRAPTSADVTVDAGLDGLSPQAALAAVKSHMTTPVAGQNARFVDQTILATHKAFTIGVSNAFTAGSPSNQFITKALAGAQVTLLGTMSALHPTVIMAKLPTDAVARFYVAADSGGGFTELPSLPYSVLMKARLQNGVTGGVRVSYATWGSNALGKQLTTITEQGSTPATASN